MPAFSMIAVCFGKMATWILKPRFLCTINAYENWITQIEILGSIPWFQGETRAGKLTALSDSFHEELLASQEPAYILGGPEHIGMFWKK